jgi:predicted GNAT family N-acyltransferase
MSQCAAKVLAELPAEPLLFRELTSASDVVALLRLRHRIYFEERSYGTPKPFGIDLTAHDACARLFGVFVGAQLVGGVRLVFRREQALAPVVHTLRAVIDPHAAVVTPRCLPSEEAFDLAATLGPRARLVDVEIGRLAVSHPAVGPQAVLQIMIATLAVLLLSGCRLYLYSCATALSKRYARVANPRWSAFAAIADGIGSDGFPFPKETVAAVAAAEDTPFFEQAIAYANAMQERGFIEIARPLRLHCGALASAGAL